MTQTDTNTKRLREWCRKIGYTKNEVKTMSYDQMVQALKKYGFKMASFKRNGK